VKHNKQYDITEDEGWEMAYLSLKQHGVDQVVIWVGADPKNRHRHRVKICNDPSGLKSKNLFIISIPELKITGDVNHTVITALKLKQIKQWLRKNMKTIIAYSENEIDTGQLFEKLI
jgi:hypothetical protein